MFAFSYSALIAPIGLDVYRVSPILVGALAAAELLGAIAIGIPLSIGWIPWMDASPCFADRCCS
jgi:hypothetical protein